MRTITINLPDDDAARLDELVVVNGMGPERVILALIEMEWTRQRSEEWDRQQMKGVLKRWHQ
jgi:hypothetical protein